LLCDVVAAGGGQGEHPGPPARACRGHRRRPVLVDAAGAGCAETAL